MKSKLLGLTATVFVLAVLIWIAAPVFGQNVGERIKTIEQELEQLKAQQIELKKEATTAAAAMPSFSYRPGNGLTIESADKSWSLRSGIETHFRILFESGRDQVKTLLDCSADLIGGCFLNSAGGAGSKMT